MVVSHQSKPIITLRGGNRLFLCYARNMSEHDEQVRFFTILSLFSGKYPQLDYIFAVPNGGARHIVVAQKMKAEGQKKGVPDILICLPRQGYTGLAIEMKFHPKKQSPEQKQYQTVMTQAGWLYVLAYSCKEAVTAVGQYMGIQELMQYDEL